MTPQVESAWVFVTVGVLVVLLLLGIVHSARHAQKIDIRSGLPYWRHRNGR